MELPNYFLADLPPEASITPSILAEACHALKRNREIYLTDRTSEQLISVFEQLGRDWLDPVYRFRKMALEKGPEATGLSVDTLSTGLDAFFRELTRGRLEDLICQELGSLDRLDTFGTPDSDGRTRRMAKARGPELIGQISAGVIPNSTLLTIILGLLVRSAQVVKCASGLKFLPRLFAHSLYEAAPKLGACLEVVEWPGGEESLETVLFQEADCVVCSGSDETLTAVRQRLPGNVRFLGYGHRVSFGFVSVEALSSSRLAAIAEKAAEDVAAWNQLGCLSPHVFYVEHGGRISAEQFAEALAGELQRLEKTQPRGSVSSDQAATIATLRSFYELRAANSLETKLWFSRESTAWTVIYEVNSLFQASCLNRFIYVKGVANLRQALEGADAIRDHVSTVGLAATGTRAETLAKELAGWGATRICPIGQMQKPPLTWRHDGRPTLGELVTWTDWER